MSVSAKWPLVYLEQVVIDIQPGFARRPDARYANTPQLRTNNVSAEGLLDLSEVKHVQATEKEIAKYGVKYGDIVFNNTNSLEWVGKSAFFGIEEPYVLSNHMTRIRADEQLIYPQFLAHYLHYLWDNDISRRWAKPWVNQAAIDRNDLARFQILLPPLPEQRRIVAILRQADELRRLRREVDTKAQHLIPAIFQEMFGTDVVEREGWTTRPLELMGEVQYGLTVNSNRRAMRTKYPYLRVANVQRGELNLSDIAEIGATTKDITKYSLEPGDVLVVEGHADTNEIGRAAVWSGEINTCLHQNHILRIRPNLDVITPDYLASCINSPSGRAYMLRHAKTSSGLNTINSTVLNNMPITQAPLHLQKTFEEYYSQHSQLTKPSEQSSARLNMLFDTLLTQAFTGELTAAWREQHAAELQIAAEERDEFLRLRGIEIPAIESPVEPVVKATRDSERPLQEFTRVLSESLNVSTLAEMVDEEEPWQDIRINPSVGVLGRILAQSLADEFSTQVTKRLTETLTQTTEVFLDQIREELHPEEWFIAQLENNPRTFLIDELQVMQYHIWLTINSTDGYVIPETLSEEIGLPLSRVRQTLELLVTGGLIIPVTLPANPTGDRTVYIPAWRAFQSERDESRLEDMEILKELTQ